MSIRYRFISLSMINSTPQYKLLRTDKYRSTGILSAPLMREKEVQHPPITLAITLLDTTREIIKQNSVTNQRTLFWFLYIYQNCQCWWTAPPPLHQDTSLKGSTTHTHNTYMVYNIYIYIYTLTGNRKLSSLFTASKPNTLAEEMR